MAVCPVCQRTWTEGERYCPVDGSRLSRDVVEGDDPLVGTLFAGRYVIHERLGTGAMGVVYLGEHRHMGRRDAIKIMSPALARDAESIARFSREAANASRIRHRNVCEVYDFGEAEEGLFYLAMEFIPGETLGDLLNREETIEPLRAARITAQVAEALQAAHDLGIVHRDVKPDNIMITTPPQGGQYGRRATDGPDFVKVVDFGIAKAVTGGKGQEVTQTGFVVGTPAYMSPEQLTGDENIDGRSDIYSLALIAFKMLTGRPPFEAKTEQDLMLKHISERPNKLGDVLPGAFPAQLESVIDRALSRERDQRPASAEEFGKEVFQAINPPSQPAPRAERRRDTTGVSAQAAREVPPTIDRPGPQTVAAGGAWTRSRRWLGIAAAAVIVVGGAAVLPRIIGSNGDPSGKVQSSDESRSGELGIGEGVEGSDSDPGPGGSAVSDSEDRDAAAPPPMVPPPVKTDLRQNWHSWLLQLEASQDTAAIDRSDADRVKGLYANPDLADSTRAQAAYVVATFHLLRGDFADCVLWSDSSLIFQNNINVQRIRKSCEDQRQDR